jgi:exodeoxyribonuclease VII small subunit
MTSTPSPATPPTPGPGDPAGRDDISYAEAQAELDAILHELDGDEVDVDVLGARVRRAAELLRLCRSRIAAARFEVEQVVGELEVEADQAAAADDIDEVDDLDDDLADDGDDDLDGDDLDGDEPDDVGDDV